MTNTMPNISRLETNLALVVFDLSTYRAIANTLTNALSTDSGPEDPADAPLLATLEEAAVLVEKAGRHLAHTSLAAIDPELRHRCQETATAMLQLGRSLAIAMDEYEVHRDVLRLRLAEAIRDQVLHPATVALEAAGILVGDATH